MVQKGLKNEECGMDTVREGEMYRDKDMEGEQERGGGEKEWAGRSDTK